MTDALESYPVGVHVGEMSGGVMTKGDGGKRMGLYRSQDKMVSNAGGEAMSSFILCLLSGTAFVGIGVVLGRSVETTVFTAIAWITAWMLANWTSHD